MEITHPLTPSLRKGRVELLKRAMPFRGTIKRRWFGRGKALSKSTSPSQGVKGEVNT